MSINLPDVNLDDWAAKVECMLNYVKFRQKFGMDRFYHVFAMVKNFLNFHRALDSALSSHKFHGHNDQIIL